MVYSQSIENIWNAIKNSDTPLTPTQIVTNYHYNFKTVKGAIAFLEKLGKIEIISNGETSLIRAKSSNGGKKCQESS